MSNPCMTCGACCAAFRVSFYWAEAAPAELTVPVNAHLVAMKGTDVKPVRCIALHGEIGLEVCCTLYAQRPSPCHEVMPADEKCNRARQIHGLPPLAPCQLLS